MLIIQDFGSKQEAATHFSDRLGGDSGGLLQPEPALPAQIHDLWHHSRAISPERELLLAVFWQAISDLQAYRYATRLRYQKVYADAYRWVTGSERHWPYAFLNVCDLLGIEVQEARQQLLQLGQRPRPASSEIMQAAA